MRLFLAACCALALPVGLAVPAAAQPSVHPAPHTNLTNLAHLDFLTTPVTPPAQAGHTTYRLASQPSVGELWVYTNHQSDGTYQRVGGGTYDATTDTYGQGAYDADDVARAAVVYLRHWQQDGDTHSRDQAYNLLRGLTYLQTASGPDAGNVVLWMQPDGTLNPSPTPTELPDPSDSGASYWLARTIWALGEGYAQFRRSDPSFAAFLKTRLDLAIGALDREVLVDYGTYQIVDGARVPAWLVVQGADASSEAVLGLAAYVRAGGGSTARTALSELADGIADLHAGNSGQWPYGALLPSATSQDQWHAWGAQMAGALARASVALRRRSLLAPALTDTASFTPQLLTATGPDNGLLPTPVDGSQIAYGADARVESLLDVGEASGSQGLTDLAGIAAGWFFGQNPSGQPTYDPATGVTDDGVNADGTLNLNSGAESTIHGLLTMLALDAHPALAALAQQSAHISSRDGQRLVEAEAGTVGGGATVQTADPAYTGESQWSGGMYVAVTPGSSVTWTLAPSAEPLIVEAVVNRVPGRAGRTTFSSGSVGLGSVSYGGGGAQGVSPAPGELIPLTVARTLPAGATTLTATTSAGSGELDALLFTPVISRLTVTGAGHASVVLSSRATSGRKESVAVPGSGLATVAAYDRHGKLRSERRTRASTVQAPVWPGGFTIVRR